MSAFLQNVSVAGTDALLRKRIRFVDSGGNPVVQEMSGQPIAEQADISVGGNTVMFSSPLVD